MNILLSYTLVGRGGDAVQVQAQADAFRDLGHHVELVGPHALEPYEFRGLGGRVRSRMRHLPWWAKDLIELGFNGMTRRRALRRLRRGSIDLIFHRAGIYDSVGPKLAAERPLIAHLDAPFALERDFRGEGYFKRMHERAMQALGRQARLLATVSQASKAYYVELGLPAEKIVVIPNGIPKALLVLGEERARNHAPFEGSSARTLGFVGSLSRWHRVDLLLEALRILNDKGIDTFRVRIVGYGEEYAHLRALARRLGLENRVEWLGPLPHRQAFEQIARFDVAMLPHTLTSGAPLKLYEYAALARPMVMPDLPNLRALFSEEEACFVTPESPQALAEAVLTLSEDVEAARRLGRRAQARVRDRTWDRLLSQLLEKLRGGSGWR